MENNINKIIWFSGLSGSGKSTLANILIKKLKKKKFSYKLLDGDQFRKNKNYKNSFTKKNIIKNNLLIIKKIKQMIKIYNFVIVSVISPLKVTRQKAKNEFGNNYIEVYVYCILRKLIKRDTKGLYKLAKKKKINNLIGYNSKIKYENTYYKKIIVNTGTQNIRQSTNKILKDLSLKFDVKI